MSDETSNPTEEAGTPARPNPVSPVPQPDDPHLAELDRRLLAIGGREVVRSRPETGAAELLAHAERFDRVVHFRPGDPAHARAIAAGVWGEDVRRYTLATGYALADGVWVQHEWVLKGAELFETTTAREQYFGRRLDPASAVGVWLAEYLVSQFPGPMAVLVGSARPTAKKKRGQRPAARAETKADA